EAFVAEIWNDVEPSEHLVFLVRLGSEVQLNDLAQPVGHELRELGQIGGNRAALSFGTKFEPRGLGSFVSSALMYLRRRIPSGPVTRHSLASPPGRGRANPPRLPRP